MKYLTSLLLVASCLFGLLFLAACDTNPAPSPTAPPQPTSTSALPATQSTATAQPEIMPTSTSALPVTTLTTVPVNTATSEGMPAGTAAAVPQSTGTAVDTAAATAPPSPSAEVPTPTNVTASGSGAQMSALQALSMLKPKALAWQQDARLAMLSDVRPGQQKELLSGTLGNPNVNEPTPAGRGRNWTVVAFSPSTKGAVAISQDGTQVDLVKEGVVAGDMISRFSSPDLADLDLSRIDLSSLVDSDKVVQQAGDRGKQASIAIALLAPDGLGVGPLPTPQTGGSAKLAYEMFSTDPSQESFIFFDAATGLVLLDSSAP